MQIIKLLLLAGVFLVGVQALRGSGGPFRKVMWRIYVLLVLLAASIAIIFPDALTRIANTVGVGRGADLLLYVLVVTFMLACVVLFRRLADLERRQTQLARAVAMFGAHAARSESGEDG